MNIRDVSRFTSPTQLAPRRAMPVGMVFCGTGSLDSLRSLQKRVSSEDERSSANYYVRLDGTIYCIAPLETMTFCMGPSQWQGMSGKDGTINETHVSVALEQEDHPFVPVTEAQYRSLADLWVWWFLSFAWGPMYTCLASEACHPLFPRFDPYNFDWERFTYLVQLVIDRDAPNYGKVVFRA